MAGLIENLYPSQWAVEDNEGLVSLAQEQKIDLVVVGPEVPLCNGVVDALNAVGILAYGPDAAGARLEGSKAYTKDFLAKYSIPPLLMEIFRKFLLP